MFPAPGGCVEFPGQDPRPGWHREVPLREDERQELERLVRSDVASARRVRQARVLLMADEDRRNGHRPDWFIAEQVGLSLRQICRIRQQFAREGLEPALGAIQLSSLGASRCLSSRLGMWKVSPPTFPVTKDDYGEAYAVKRRP